MKTSGSFGATAAAQPPTIPATSDRRYRVLFVASHAVQYQAPIFRRLAEHPEVDMHVAYCTLKGAEAALDPEFGAKIQWDLPLLDGYPWSEVPNRGSGNESFFGLCNPGLWKMIRAGSYDAVVCYVGYVRATFWISKVAARLSNTAFLFGTDATSVFPLDGRKWKVPIKKLFWPWLFRLADQVIVPSSASVQMMRDLFIPEHRISLTPFVVDNDWWIKQAARTHRAATRAQWGVPEHDLVILFCAKLQDWKRPLDLLRAFAKADVPDSTLVFAGEGPLRSQIGAEAAELGIASRVRILGFTNQSELPAVYSAADLFVLSSRYDACPVVVCEAMLCGLPVVLSDRVRGRFDLVQNEFTGEIFPCGDVDALAASLSRLLGDRTRLATLASNARERMKSWSPRENIAATVEAIKKAVAYRHSEPFRNSTVAPAGHPRPSTIQKLHE